jgi:hypothetical protein
MKFEASAVAGHRAALIGDLVGSRTVDDRRELHQRLTETLHRVQAEVPALDPPTVTAGDEFQGSYARIGEALQAGFLIRVLLAPDYDVRFGIGWGTAELLDAEDRTQDGPAWWQARSAIEAVERHARHPGTKHVRFGFRADPEPERRTPGGPDEAAIAAALLCRDHLMGSLDDRSMRILGGLVDGRSKSDVARSEAISASAVSQRAQRDGLDVIIAASAMLREVR